MFRTFLLMLFLCGLTAVSVVLSYRASAEPFACHVAPICLPEAPLGCQTIACLPEVQPPECEVPDCAVLRPLLRRSCAQMWREHLRDTVRRSPQRFPCFVDEKFDKLQTVSRVSTLDILRAMSR